MAYQKLEPKNASILKSEKNFGMLETHIDLFEEEKN
jgi:hypothetical protein